MQDQREVIALIGRQIAEFDVAAKLRTRVIQIQLAIGAITALTAFVTDDHALYLAAILVVVLAGVWVFLSWRMVKVRAHAERLRRTTLVAGGLGLELDGAELLELAADASASEEAARSKARDDYFASKSPPGPRRLAEMLEESAFWTTALAGKASKEAWVLFICTIASLAVLLTASVVVLSPGRWELAARAALALLAVMLSTDVLGAALSYTSVANETRRTIDRLEGYLKSGAPLERLLLILSDYNSAVESMPTFPAKLYSRHEKALNEQYGRYMKTKADGQKG